MEPSSRVRNNVKIVEPEDIASADCAGEVPNDGEEGVCLAE